MPYPYIMAQSKTLVWIFVASKYDDTYFGYQYHYLKLTYKLDIIFISCYVFLSIVRYLCLNGLHLGLLR